MSDVGEHESPLHRVLDTIAHAVDTLAEAGDVLYDDGEVANIKWARKVARLEASARRLQADMRAAVSHSTA